MKSQKSYNTILFTVLWIVLGVVALSTIIYMGDIVVNKHSRTVYEKLDNTDRRMFEQVAECLKNDDGTMKKFSMPIAFVRDRGLARGQAYLFNHNITECKGAFAMNGGTFATEILLPNELNLPTMYRLATFEPALGSYLFPSDYKTVDVYGTQTYVVCYDAGSLKDGTFNALLQKAMSNNG